MNPLSQDELARDQTPQRFRDLVELVRLRAEAQPRKTAYIFLDDGEIESGRLSFSELDRIARAIASHLQCMDVRGKSVLLLYPPGIDYVGAFFGCIYAGAIAVPAYPPSKHHVHRLLSIVDDASPSLVMTTPELRDKLESASRETWKQPTLSWLATNTCDTHNAENWVPHAPGPDSLAFLQYTSGSTGNPRGVMVSHGNVLANQELIKRSFQHTSESIVVGWLPLYHDMGLIGNILQPLYLGSTAVLMSPLAFLEKPIRWLRAISKYRAITSGGPSFSYEHCVRRITAEQKQGLDLSRWRLAFNGAEPVRATTMERFYNVFADCGFRREAFAPCYGLAESTLFAAGPSAGTPNVMRRLDRAALKEHRVMEASVAVAPSDVVVSCGQVGTGHEIRVVDPATGTLLSDERVGEIWLAGPSVAQGYWRRPEESEHTFRATLTGESVGRFLRTGDLGFVDHSEVYVTGRIKDLIIIGGRNYYPQDFERVLDEQFEALRPASPRLSRGVLCCQRGRGSARRCGGSAEGACQDGAQARRRSTRGADPLLLWGRRLCLAG